MSTHTCAHCGLEGAGFKRCVTCTSVRYCSAGCQAMHWRAGHRFECASLAARKIERDEAERRPRFLDARAVNAGYRMRRASSLLLRVLLDSSPDSRAGQPPPPTADAMMQLPAALSSRLAVLSFTLPGASAAMAFSTALRWVCSLWGSSWWAVPGLGATLFALWLADLALIGPFTPQLMAEWVQPDGGRELHPAPAIAAPLFLPLGAAFIYIGARPCTHALTALCGLWHVREALADYDEIVAAEHKRVRRTAKVERLMRDKRGVQQHAELLESASNRLLSELLAPCARLGFGAGVLLYTALPIKSAAMLCLAQGLAFLGSCSANSRVWIPAVRLCQWLSGTSMRPGDAQPPILIMSIMIGVPVVVLLALLGVAHAVLTRIIDGIGWSQW